MLFAMYCKLKNQATVVNLEGSTRWLGVDVIMLVFTNLLLLLYTSMLFM